MSILVAIIGVGAGTQFISDAGGECVSDSGGIFEDSIDIMRLSVDNFYGNHHWPNDILAMDPIAYKCDNLHGGMIRISGNGSIEIAMKAFDSASWWITGPYISTFPCVIYYTDTAEGESIKLMDCTLFLQSIDPPLSYTFGIYPNISTKNLLGTDSDNTGATVVLPVAIGNVSYVTPVRLANSGPYRNYSAGGLIGTKHVDWHVFDDGIDICSNATAISLNVFALTVTPVGAVTISGSGPARYIKDIFTLYCGSAWLNLGFVNDFVSGGISLAYLTTDKWVTEQTTVVDFLSSVAAAASQYFYILAGTLYGHYFGTTYYPLQTLDVAIDTLEGTKYETRQPWSWLRHKWKSRASVAERIGQYVKEADQEEAGATGFPFGSDTTLDMMTETRSTANTKIQNCISYNHSIQFVCILPLKGFMRPGTAIFLTNTRYLGRQVEFNNGYARDITFDFYNRKVTVEGSGAFMSF